MDKPRVIVYGRFPPPADGQSVSTQRFVQLLHAEFNVSTISSSVSPDASELKKVVSYFSSGLKLADALSDVSPECIIWPSISPQTSGHIRDRLAVLPHLENHRTIAVVHWGSFARVFTQALTSGSAQKMAQKIDHFVFTDHDLSDACGKWIPEDRRSVIANTLDSEIVCSDDEIETKLSGALDRPLRLLFVSNMIREKGYLDVLEAVSGLRAREINVSLDLVGRWSSDNDRAEFDEIVGAFNLSDDVIHHGLVLDRKELKQHYLRADVLVFPTYLEEAQPLCIIEAMNAAVPVISTREGGISNMIRNGEQGLFVEPKNPLSIVDAALKYEDRNFLHASSVKARARYKELYDPAAIQSQWVELIRKIHPNA